MPITADLRLNKANFGVFPFDYDHALQTSILAERIGQSLGLDGDELQACRAAGMFHDLGRNVEGKKNGKVSNWWEKHSDHHLRSAELADVVLLDDVNFDALGDIRSRVCRVIGQHNIFGPAPSDPIARALYDADILEAARLVRDDIRFNIAVIRDRYSRLCTEWARNPEVQARVIRDRAVAPGVTVVDGQKWNDGSASRLLRGK